MRELRVGWKSSPTLFVALICCIGGANAQAANVTTYHNDNLRTGWNQTESILTQSAVSGSSFKLLASTTLDDQVDAQPLIVTSEPITGQGTHDVVYVATENNSVYAVDASSGAVLLHVNLGAPVPYPLGCGNNGPNVGINSTPVIDTSSSTLYVVTYTLESNNPVFRIHALDLSSLNDKTPSVVVTASGKLTNNSNYQFNPAVSRQRAALLLANGNVYAGFASFCDFNANQSRGWVLGWKAGTLVPLAANHLTDQLATSMDNYFLTSIWMSGYGLAASSQGSIYFVTGNSDYSGNSYNPVTNIAESVGELSADLSSLKGVFTPKNQPALDQADADFGSGGVMLLPTQKRTITPLAVAAGKDGNLYLLNAAKLKTSLASYQIGGCWCGPSYFQGHDGTGRVVTSGGSNVGVWKVQGTTRRPQLALVNQSAGLNNGQDGGFFTSISSNGTTAGTAVIWALGRPVDSNPANITLYAFNGDNASTLFSAVAGTWPNVGGNANIVPTVANGKVYVASNQQLAIFGLSTGPAAVLPQVAAHAVPRAPLALGQHEIFGIVRSIAGNTVIVVKRTGEVVVVDATEASSKFRFAEPTVGHALIARGTYGARGVFAADAIMHAKDNPRIWLPDR